MIFKTPLRNIIQKLEIKEEFIEEIFTRSGLFFDFEVLTLFWDLLNFIRNKIAHNNGFYGKEDKGKFTEKLNLFLQHFESKNKFLLSVNLIQNEFEKYEEQIAKTSYILIDDTLENIIRNLSVFVMEALYSCIEKNTFK